MKKAAYLAFTAKGKALADTLCAALGGVSARCNEPQGMNEWTAQHFAQCDALVFIGAAGIAVRAVAPYLQSKTTDPAVVVVDECARFAVPLISGHLGGANDLAREIARVCGAVPVITTATDANGVFAVDEWTKQQNAQIVNPEKIKVISGKLLAGMPIAVSSAWSIAGTPPPNVAVTQGENCDVRLSMMPGGGCALCAVPRIAFLGIGCRKQTSRKTLETVLETVLKNAAMAECAIAEAATIDLKKNEPGLLEFCAAHGWALETYSAAQLQKAKGRFSSSVFVREITGVDNVCERSAVLASGGELCQRKYAENGVTMALALAPYEPDWRWQDESEK